MPLKKSKQKQTQRWFHGWFGAKSWAGDSRNCPVPSAFPILRGFRDRG